MEELKQHELSIDQRAGCPIDLATGDLLLAGAVSVENEGALVAVGVDQMERGEVGALTDDGRHYEERQVRLMEREGHLAAVKRTVVG